MEPLHTSHYSNPNCFAEGTIGTAWTEEENKQFERALAVYGEDTPDRWMKVAAMTPGKTVSDVYQRYKELEENVSDIEAGRIPLPSYPISSYSSERDHNGKRKRLAIAWGSEEEGFAL